MGLYHALMDETPRVPRDWSGFTHRIYVGRAKEDLWSALATPGGIASWFTYQTTIVDKNGRRLAEDQFPSQGDSVHWEWTEGTTEEARILEFEPVDRIKFSWYGDKGWVEFRVRENDGRNYVELEQRMEGDDAEFLQDVYVGCAEGWTFFLANLKSILEGGLDLREYRADMRGLINV